MIDCLPGDCRQLLEFVNHGWQPLLDTGPVAFGTDEDGLISLAAFGCQRGLMLCTSPLDFAWKRCLERLLEARLQERCRALLLEAPEAALRELLPATTLRMGEPGEHTLELGQAAAAFFQVDRVGWDSCQPGTPDLIALRDWLEQQCSSPQDRLGEQDYSSLLGVFGHHVGTLFKTSGAMNIWAQPDYGYDPTRRVLDKLLPIWGVSQAISLHKKQGEKGWREILRDWVDPAQVERPDLAEEVRRSILSLCLYVYAHGVDEPPFLPWVIHQSDGGQARWVWATADTLDYGVQEDLIERAVTSLEAPAHKVEVESQTHRLVSLPPLADNPILFDKSLALTIGLFEMLSNLRKYPEARGAGREDRQDLAQLLEVERQVDLYCREVDGSTVLEIFQPVVTLPNGGIPVSRSVDRIRGLERSLLKGIVETGRAEVVGTTSLEYVVQTRQTWTYHWRRLLEEWQCHANCD